MVIIKIAMFIIIIIVYSDWGNSLDLERTDSNSSLMERYCATFQLSWHHHFENCSCDNNNNNNNHRIGWGVFSLNNNLHFQSEHKITNYNCNGDEKNEDRINRIWMSQLPLSLPKSNKIDGNLHETTEIRGNCSPLARPQHTEYTIKIAFNRGRDHLGGRIELKYSRRFQMRCFWTGDQIIDSRAVGGGWDSLVTGPFVDRLNKKNSKHLFLVQFGCVWVCTIPATIVSWESCAWKRKLEIRKGNSLSLDRDYRQFDLPKQPPANLTPPPPRGYH